MAALTRLLSVIAGHHSMLTRAARLTAGCGARGRLKVFLLQPYSERDVWVGRYVDWSILFGIRLWRRFCQQVGQNNREECADITSGIECTRLRVGQFAKLPVHGEKLALPEFRRNGACCRSTFGRLGCFVGHLREKCSEAVTENFKMPLE
jgi:hypothetical protein